MKSSKRKMSCVVFTILSVLPLITQSMSLPQPVPQNNNTKTSKVRTGRQALPGGEACTFGTGPDEANLCGWSRSNLSSLQWEVTFGVNSNWVGGPATDANDVSEGGYILFETSQIPNISGRTSQSAVFEGPVRGPSTAQGLCLSFNYALEGLSPEKVRVLLHPIHEVNEYTVDGHPLNREFDRGADVVLWETGDSTDGVWRAAEVVYTCRQSHQKLRIQDSPPSFKSNRPKKATRRKSISL